MECHCVCGQECGGGGGGREKEREETDREGEDGRTEKGEGLSDEKFSFLPSIIASILC